MRSIPSPTRSAAIAVATLGAWHELLESHTPSSDSWIIKAWVSKELDGGARPEAEQGSRRGESSSDEDEAERALAEAVRKTRSRVELQLLIAEDDAVEGTYRISCTRVRGQTLEFHRVYRRFNRALGLTSANERGAVKLLAGSWQHAAGCSGVAFCGVEGHCGASVVGIPPRAATGLAGARPEVS